MTSHTTARRLSGLRLLAGAAINAWGLALIATQLR